MLILISILLKGWTVLPKIKVLGLILFVGCCGDLLQVVVVEVGDKVLETQLTL